MESEPTLSPMIRGQQEISSIELHRKHLKQRATAWLLYSVDDSARAALSVRMYGQVDKSTCRRGNDNKDFEKNWNCKENARKEVSRFSCQVQIRPKKIARARNRKKKMLPLTEHD